MFKLIIENNTKVKEENIIKAVNYIVMQGKIKLNHHGMGYPDMRFEDVICKCSVSENGTDIFKFNYAKDSKNYVPKKKRKPKTKKKQ